jgi:hypothetical protein
VASKKMPECLLFPTERQSSIGEKLALSNLAACQPLGLLAATGPP